MEDLNRILENRPSYTLEGLAKQANTLLQGHGGTEVHDRRVKTEVNPRLIRHYVSENLLDPALREGRKALYSTDHLLQLLALRRMLADGYSSKMIGDSLRQLGRDELIATFEHGATGTAQARTPAEGAIAQKRASARAALDAIRQRTASAQGLGASPQPSSPPSSSATTTAPATPQPTNVGQRPAPASQPASQDISHWERVPLLDGVELHVRSDVRLPTSLADQQALLDYVVQQLVLYAQRRS